MVVPDESSTDAPEGLPPRRGGPFSRKRLDILCIFK